MESALQKYQDLIPIIEKIASDMAQKIVDETLNKAQYTVPDVPDHHHNGQDSTQLDPESITTVLNLPATKGGVVSPTTLVNQLVGQGPALVGFGNLNTGNTAQQSAKFVSFPVPIIYGHGVGTDSQFNGGDATQGTMVFFDNGATLSGLWILLSDGTWRGTAPGTFNITL